MRVPIVCINDFEEDISSAMILRSFASLPTDNASLKVLLSWFATKIIFTSNRDVYRDVTIVERR